MGLLSPDDPSGFVPRAVAVTVTVQLRDAARGGRRRNGAPLRVAGVATGGRESTCVPDDHARIEAQQSAITAQAEAQQATKAAQADAIETLRRLNERLEPRVAALERQLTRNSRNSGKPPSQGLRRRTPG